MCIKFTIGLATLLNIGFVTSCFGQDVLVADIFNCVRFNMSAIDSADVLIIRESTLDTAKIDGKGGMVGTLLTKDTNCRVKFDLSKSQIAYVSETKVQGVDFSHLKSPVEIDRGFRRGAWAENSFDKITVLRDAKTSVWNKSRFGDQGDRILEFALFPDPRQLPFSGSLGVWKPVDLSRSVAPTGFSAGKAVKSTSRSEGLVTVAYETLLSKDIPDRVVNTVVKYDLKNLMPVSIKSTHFDVRQPERASLLLKVSLQWETIDGIEVPVAVRRTEPSQFEIKGEPIGGLAETTLRLHWFSINKPPFPPDFFSSINKLDNNFIKKLIDPKAARATSLLGE